MLLLICVLAGCNAPGLAFRDSDATRITVAGSTFDVRIKDQKAEAIRLNAQYAPRLGPIGARAAFAMEKVSGCSVSKIDGDAAVVHGTLRCGQTMPQRPAWPRNVELDCYAIDSHVSPATSELVTYYDCDVLTD